LNKKKVKTFSFSRQKSAEGTDIWYLIFLDISFDIWNLIFRDFLWCYPSSKHYHPRWGGGLWIWLWHSVFDQALRSGRVGEVNVDPGERLQSLIWAPFWSWFIPPDLRRKDKSHQIHFHIWDHENLLVEGFKFLFATPHTHTHMHTLTQTVPHRRIVGISVPYR
jgi:hypothetical protein